MTINAGARGFYPASAHACHGHCTARTRWKWVGVMASTSPMVDVPDHWELIRRSISTHADGWVSQGGDAAPGTHDRPRPEQAAGGEYEHSSLSACPAPARAPCLRSPAARGLLDSQARQGLGSAGFCCARRRRTGSRIRDFAALAGTALHVQDAVDAWPASRSCAWRLQILPF
jgi:hypothetical protein